MARPPRETRNHSRDDDRDQDHDRASHKRSRGTVPPPIDTVSEGRIGATIRGSLPNRSTMSAWNASIKPAEATTFGESGCSAQVLEHEHLHEQSEDDSGDGRDDDRRDRAHRVAEIEAADRQHQRPVGAEVAVDERAPRAIAPAAKLMTPVPLNVTSRPSASAANTAPWPRPVAEKTKMSRISGSSRRGHGQGKCRIRRRSSRGRRSRRRAAALPVRRRRLRTPRGRAGDARHVAGSLGQMSVRHEPSGRMKPGMSLGFAETAGERLGGHLGADRPS